MMWPWQHGGNVQNALLIPSPLLLWCSMRSRVSEFLEFLDLWSSTFPWSDIPTIWQSWADGPALFHSWIFPHFLLDIVLRPRAYHMCHAFICTYILLYTSCVSLMCTTGPPYRSYQTSPLSRYLAALDLLTRHGSPAYLGHTSHACAAPPTHIYLYCFWHAWVISAAMTPISSAAYSVRYCTSVSPFLASWRVFLACYDSYFTWILVTRSHLYI